MAVVVQYSNQVTGWVLVSTVKTNLRTATKLNRGGCPLQETSCTHTGLALRNEQQPLSCGMTNGSHAEKNCWCLRTSRCGYRLHPVPCSVLLSRDSWARSRTSQLACWWLKAPRTSPSFLRSLISQSGWPRKSLVHAWMHTIVRNGSYQTSMISRVRPL